MQKVVAKLPVKITATPAPNCRVCGDTGHGEDGFCNCRAAVAEKRGMFTERLARAAAPTRAAGYPMLRMDRSRVKFISNYEGGSIILYGEIGTGKTVMAVAILKALLWRSIETPWGNNFRPMFVAVPEFFRNLELTYKELLNAEARERAKGYVDLFHRAVDADFLILDDIGKEKMSPARAQDLYTLINARYNHERDTVVTLNARGRDALKEIEGHIGGRHGEAIASRLAEMTPSKNRCRLGGGDRRL